MEYSYEKNLKSYHGDYLNVHCIKKDVVLIDVYIVFNEYQFGDDKSMTENIVEDCMNSKDFIQKNQFEMEEYIKAELDRNDIDFQLIVVKWRLNKC